MGGVRCHYHPFTDGIVIGPYIPLRNIPGLKDTTLVKKLVQFSENQNPKNLNNESIDNIIKNIGEENFQALSKLMENLPTKQAKGLEKSLQKSLRKQTLKFRQQNKMTNPNDQWSCSIES